MFYAILILGAIVGGVFLLRRLQRAIVRVANRKLLYRSEYEQGRQIVSMPVRISIPAPVSDIMREVTAHVTTTELPLGLKAGVYELSRTADQITYAFGNKLMPRSFEVDVLFAGHGATTDVTFRVLKWREKDGLMLGRETLERLRGEVLVGFTAAGADTTITDGLAIEHGPIPAAFTDQTGLKKYAFGVVGGILIVIAIVKFSVIGCYPREEPLYLGMLIAGGVCVYLSSKMKISKSGGDPAGGYAVPASGSTVASHIANDDVRAPLAHGDQSIVAQAGGKEARYCTGCGSPISADVAFCTSCGTKVRR
jgi:hypothetical protein